ncbi:hypothetical protein [uncultured Dokdonia sp.]|uniref:hypothetical protein n=1 Tax=uncultured Dokdonia sp. TaxID=575653 RepID=UPI0026295148|nr:hypothetical protein [uncultured Dokdonia sp.]
MKYFYTILCILFLVTSCSSVKKSTSSILSGNYDQAISTSVQKLRKNPTKKNKESHILLLEEAFAKAAQRDTDRISYLQKEDNPNTIEEIYQLYKTLHRRQEIVKPLLPLQLQEQARDAVFDIKNYDSELIASKRQLTDLLYNQAVTAFSTANSKVDYRRVHNDLEYLDDLTPNHKDVHQLLEEAHYKGTDYIEVALYNDSDILLPRRLQDDLLDFSTYDLNDFWKVYHSTPQQGVTYDYLMDVSLREINISPERFRERELQKEKSIKDGTEYLLDDDGNFVIDEDGEKVKVDKMITVRCSYYEVLQTKAVNIIGQVRYTSQTTNQVIESFPLASEFVFEHYFATYDGDKRALDNDLLRYTRNREVPFPSNEQMVYDVGEDLKQRLKSIIVKTNI